MRNLNLKVLKFCFVKHFCYCNEFKLFFSKQVIFAFKKRYFEKALSNWAEFSGFVVLSNFQVLRNGTFHVVHCVEVM